MLRRIDRTENQLSKGNQEGSVTRRNIFLRMLTLAAALPTSGALLARAAAKGDSHAGHGFYKIVNYQAPPERWQEFLEACKVNTDASLKETGITRFEVLIARDTPNTVIAIEVYRDEDASNAHQQTAHFHAFVQAAQTFGVKRSLVVASGYYPG